MKMRVNALALMLPLLASGMAAAQWSPGSTVPLVMEDQFGRRHDVAAHRGDVVVLIYGDRRSADANRALGEALHVYFHPTARGLPPAQAQKAPVRPLPNQAAGVRSPDVLTVPVACLGKVPAVVRALIAWQIRSASPDVPVWLDSEDRMSQTFFLEEGVPNLIVLDRTGCPRRRMINNPSPEQFAELTAFIEELRREVPPPAFPGATLPPLPR